jgi:hypothetical protein
MHAHWLNKRRRSPGIANDRVDDACNPADTPQAMAAAGASGLPFGFEFVGAYSTEYT